MELEALKDAWQRHTPAGAAGEGVNMGELFAQLDRLEHNLRNRDLRETIASLAVIAFFTWRLFAADGSLERIGAGIIVCTAAFTVVWEQYAARPRRRVSAVSGDLPLAQFCRRELERVDAEIRLLRTVWLRSVVPVTIGVELILLGRWAVPSGRQAVMMVVALVIGVSVHRLNVAAAKNGLLPIRGDLERRIEEFRVNG